MRLANQDVWLETGMAAIITGPSGTRYALFPLHPLHVLNLGELTAVAAQHNATAVYATTFDMNVRPFWVWSRITTGESKPL